MPTTLTMSQYEECFHGSLVDEIIALPMNVGALIIIITIGIMTRNKFASDTTMKLELEILFYIAIAAACYAQIGSILSIVLCRYFGARVQLFAFLFGAYYGFIFLFTCLVATLIIRLYLTFRHSVWRMSTTKLIISMFLTMIMLFIWIIDAIARWMDWIDAKRFFAVVGVGWIFCMFLSIEAVYYFIRNLLALAKLRGTVRDVNASAEQQKLINVSAKYLILFLVAVCTSTVMSIMTALSRITLDIHPGISWSIDAVINVLCLYLQVQILLYFQPIIFSKRNIHVHSVFL